MLKDKQLVYEIMSTIPLRKVSTPEDIAAVVIFMAVGEAGKKLVILPGELSDFCILATYYDLGLAQAFNPELTIELPVDMIRGDCDCKYVFEEKE